jgi:hypothetical protein
MRGRPLPGGRAALHRERGGGAGVRVGEQRNAHRHLSLAGERLGQHRRGDFSCLEHRGHLRQRVVRETHAGYVQPVIRQDGGGQQVQDVPWRVDADDLAFQACQRRDVRIGHHVEALAARLHHRAFGENIQVGGDHGIVGRGRPLALVVVFLGLDVADVVAAGDVDPVVRLIERLGVDDRLGTDRRHEGDVQAARREQAFVQRHEETGRIDRGYHRHIQVRLLDRGRGGVPAAGQPGQEQDRQDGDGDDGDNYLRGPLCPREPAYQRRVPLFSGSAVSGSAGTFLAPANARARAAGSAATADLIWSGSAQATPRGCLRAAACGQVRAND